MLEEAVAELRGEPISRELDPELTVDVPGFIPDDYVPDTGQRLDLYKRLAGADGRGRGARACSTEIADRYGPLPDEVQLLGELMVVKALGPAAGRAGLELTATRLALALADDTPLQPEQVLALVSRPRARRTGSPPTCGWRRLRRAASSRRLRRRARRCLLELLACAT